MGSESVPQIHSATYVLEEMVEFHRKNLQEHRQRMADLNQPGLRAWIKRIFSSEPGMRFHYERALAKAKRELAEEQVRLEREQLRLLRKHVNTAKLAQLGIPEDVVESLRKEWDGTND